MSEQSDKTQPRFIDVAGEYEICRFDNGSWSLRDKLPDGDRAHVRYLSPFEQGLVEGALRSLSPSSTTAALPPSQESIAAADAILRSGTYSDGGWARIVANEIKRLSSQFDIQGSHEG